jgi:3-deoxy-manno-octulosonate cytidylyltransferase (CMP-KDO synthetase)
MSLSFKIVIPARLGSTRLQGKVLRSLAGKPLVQHVWEAAGRSGAEEVVIATDDAQVQQACEGFGARVRMTDSAHPSGTDRINEVARAAGWPADTLIVNLQGDEPLMPPPLLRQVAQLLADDPAADLATLCHPLHEPEAFRNPNVVKLVMDRRGYALYFSRAPIPWKRNGAEAGPALLPMGLAYRHIGLYAYRAGALAEFSALPPSPLENCEALEQLRALSHGMRIKVGVAAEAPPPGVDTEADLQAVERLFAAPE